jgi:hypothetical protein
MEGEPINDGVQNDGGAQQSGEGQQPPAGGEPQVPQADGQGAAGDGQGGEKPLSDDQKRLLNEFQAWTGRREKKLLDDVSQIVAQQVGYQMQQHQPAYQAPPPAADDINLYDDPRGGVKRVINEMQTQQTQFNQAVTNGVNAMFANDPLMREDPELAKEAWEVAKGIYQPDFNLNPMVQAQLVAANAKNIVLTNRIQKKKLPFDGRQLNNLPLGGIGPGNQGGGGGGKKKMPVLDPAAAEYARSQGLTEAQITEILGTE